MKKNSLPRVLGVVLTLLALTLTGVSLGGTSATASVAPATSQASTTSTGVGLATAKAAAITYRTVRERQRIPFGIRTVKTSKLPRGVKRVVRWGHPGKRVVVWRVKLRDGRKVHRTHVRTTVVRRPVSRLVKLGTGRRTSGGGGGGSTCDPNYRGACVPIASDVDCAGGSGNGPKYVQGPVYVVGDDIYDLDSDGDGVGCES